MIIWKVADGQHATHTPAQSVLSVLGIYKIYPCNSCYLSSLTEPFGSLWTYCSGFSVTWNCEPGWQVDRLTGFAGLVWRYSGEPARRKQSRTNTRGFCRSQQDTGISTKGKTHNTRYLSNQENPQSSATYHHTGSNNLALTWWRVRGYIGGGRWVDQRQVSHSAAAAAAAATPTVTHRAGAGEGERRGEGKQGDQNTDNRKTTHSNTMTCLTETLLCFVGISLPVPPRFFFLFFCFFLLYQSHTHLLCWGLTWAVTPEYCWLGSKHPH